jgi:archaellum component FlaC
MLDTDLLIAFLFMAILFLRQIYILKQPNKIDYAPLMVGVGAISSIIHFTIHTDITDITLLLRESFLPLLVSFIFYIIMNILHQTQQKESEKLQEDFSSIIARQVGELKEYMGELEVRMILSKEEDKKVQEELREKFKQDIKILDKVLQNQSNFLEKFSEMELWHKSVAKSFENFTKVQLPELDDVVHRHIDMLRVAEQDHFNKVKATLDRAVESRVDISQEIEEVKNSLSSMQAISENIAKAITKHTISQLSGVTKAFEGQLVSLKSHTEGVSTSLYESESRLSSIREQSEMIMKQMVLSSKKMDELQEQNSSLYNLYMSIKEVVTEIEAIKSDYVKAQSQLNSIVKDIDNKQEQDLQNMKESLESLIFVLSKRIDESLNKLHQHYHIASEDITQSVQILAKKAQVKSSYTDEDTKV